MSLPDTPAHATDTRDLAGKTMVVTGASAGIGAMAAGQLAARGARVVVVGRNPERTAAVAAKVGGEHLVADFARLEQVAGLARTLQERYPRIDALLNNAGGMFTPRALSADGHEMTLQVNHLAPFLLTTALLPRLIETAAATGSPARVVSTASVAHLFGALHFDDVEWERRRWLGGWQAYGTAKLMTILFARELAARSGDDGILSFSVHPGGVNTNFGAKPDGGFSIMQSAPARAVLLTPDEGAAPLVRLATSDDVLRRNGGYFDRFRHRVPGRSQAYDPVLAADLWTHTEQLVGPFR